MIKFIKFKLSFWRAKRMLASKLKPDPKFLERARRDFLSRLSSRGIDIMVVGRRFNAFVKYSIVFGIILGLNGALVAFAQGQNIYPTQPLYPYKRLGENVALVLASSQSKPYLHKTFAERRLNEIKSVVSNKPSNSQEILSELDKDFKYEVNEALSSVESDDGANKLSFCSSFGNMILQQSKISNMSDNQWLEFENDCGGTPSNFKIELE